LKSSPLLKDQRIPIYNVPPPDSRPPYVTIGTETVTDWKWQGGGGDDHRFRVTLWDADEDFGNTKKIVAGIEKAVLSVPRKSNGIKIVQLTRTQSTLARKPKQWTEAASEFRALVVMES